MPRKTRTPFEVKHGSTIRLTSLHEPKPRKARSPAAAKPRPTPLPRNDWKPPRSATRATSLTELAHWLALRDGRAVRAAADRGDIRLQRVTPRRFCGCMMDVARCNPRCLREAARE